MILTIILHKFLQDYLPKRLSDGFKEEVLTISESKQPIYVEVFAFSNNTRTKIEQ